MRAQLSARAERPQHSVIKFVMFYQSPVSEKVWRRCMVHKKGLFPTGTGTGGGSTRMTS